MATDSSGNRSLPSRQWQSFIGINSDSDSSPKTAVRVNDATISSNKLAISAESVSFAAGAIGTTGVVTLDKAPVYNVDGGLIGSLGDTSLAWITGTILTTEVKYNDQMTDAVQLAALSNGEYAINYDLGRIRYKKATNGVGDTCNYTSRQLNIEITGGTPTLSIGSTKIEDAATSSQRALVKAGNTFAVGDNAIGVADANVLSALAAIAIPTTIAGGTQTVVTAGIRVALAGSTTIKSVSIRASAANLGIIYVGGVTVTSANGIALAANDQTEFNISNLATVYIDASIDAQSVGFTYFN